MYVNRDSLKRKPKCRVELHIHLEGAVRPETIWEFLRKKNIALPGNGSLKDLKEFLVVSEPKDLAHFLQPINYYMPALTDDLEAVERISYEFVEDQARESVLYCEARICPQLFLSEQNSLVEGKNGEMEATKATNGDADDVQETSLKNSSLTIDCVTEACLRGLQRGEAKFETKVRLILFCLLGKPDWSWDTLRLCEKYKDKGVVGIDIASHTPFDGDCKIDEEIKIFEKAKEKGIHITVHAGEVGGSEEIQKALSHFNAERIGHGYHVMEDEELYKKCLEDRVHFEMCPHSSYLTGSIKNLTLNSNRHPIVRLSEDEASFSISSDNPTCTDSRIGNEYELLQKWGFTEGNFTKANFEAAKRCFLSPNEKEQLLDKLRMEYGIPAAPLMVDIITSSPPPVCKHASHSPSPPRVKPSMQSTTGRSIKRPEVKIASWEDRLY